ncbi:MAG: hypothetical protein OEZ22_01105 [Spirochaetia bacterium]|nr:hypothetical protein [Spirochaetia bacterium]
MGSRLVKVFFRLAALSAVLNLLYLNIYIVPYGYLGVFYEHVLGWQKPPIKEGYHWIYTGFVPGKWKLYTIDLNPPNVIVDFKKGLQYADYLELSDAFRMNAKIRIKYSYDENSVISLLENFEGNLTQIPDLIKERVNILLELKFYEFYQKQSDISSLKAKLYDYLGTNRSENSFYNDWQKIFSYEKIELKKWEVLEMYMPEETIYLEQIKNIENLFSARREASVQRIINESEVQKIRLQNEAEIEKARKISSLIKENPKLLDYLKIEKLNPHAKIIMLEGNSKNIPYMNENESTVENKKSSESAKDEEGMISPLGK